MFAGLSIALSALYSQRQAMEVTGHNIANVNTEGYTRQRARLQGVGGSTTPAFYSVGNGIGRGVEVSDIERLRDAFLEIRGQQEHSLDTNYITSQSVYQRVELLFAEPGDTGIQSQLANFWSAWDDVAARPGDAAARSQLIETTKTMTATFNKAATDLEGLQSHNTDQLKSYMTEINAISAQVADLNHAIKNATNSGLSPNDLSDKRDVLVMKLAEIAGSTTRMSEGGTVDVYIGGMAIVRGSNSYGVHVDDTTQPTVVRFDSDDDPNTIAEGLEARVSGGRIGGLLEAINVTYPSYVTSLNAITDDLRARVNAQQAGGIDLNGNPGAPFFDTGTVGAKFLKVDDAIAADYKLVAAGTPGGGPLDGENARLMANLVDASNGPDSEYRKMINRLGIESQRASRRADIQSQIRRQIDTARDSEAGVNLDEEQANLISFQRAYQGSAKVIQAIDEMTETLINLIR